MAKKLIVGLEYVKMGNIAPDGGMGTSLVSIGAVVKGTPVLDVPEGTTTDIDIEDSDDPYYSVTVPGKKTLKFSTYAVDAYALQRVFGGTIIPGSDETQAPTWNAPANIPQMEQSLEIKDKQGGIIRIPHAKVTTVAQLRFQKDALAQLDITATILQPDKAGVASWSYTGGKTETPLTLDTTQSFSSAKTQTTNGVTTTLDAISATIKFEFNKITSPSGTPMSMTLKQGGTEVAVVDFPSDYAGKPWRFTDAAGVKHTGSFVNGDVTVS